MTVDKRLKENTVYPHKDMMDKVSNCYIEVTMGDLHFLQNSDYFSTVIWLLARYWSLESK